MLVFFWCPKDEFINNCSKKLIKLMSPLNAAICTTMLHIMSWMILSKKQLFDLTLRSKSHKGHYGMRHTTLWSCTHIPNKYYLKNNYLRSKVITVRDTPPYGHVPTYEISLTYLERHKSYGPDKFHWEEAEAEEKIRLKQCVSLRSKGRHNYTLENSMCQNIIETSMAEKSMNNP